MGLFSDKGKARSPAPQQQPKPAAPTPAPKQQSKPAPAGYGIEQAIELMRGLPQDLEAAGVMVQVIKRTLESARIDVSRIIADASIKEERLDARLQALRDEISTHQREVATRTAEISKLQAELEEVSRVKERLVMSITEGK